jgi:Zn finger protein HypA/HybF involved in hydrogenase expression
MALLDNIGKKITATTQNVVRGTKDFTDIARLNSLISDEQRQIAGLHSQIGKLYFETVEHDENTPLGKLCLAIVAANERIAKHQREIREIKGTKKCPSCGADVPLSSAFCGNCGAKTEAAATLPKPDAPITDKKFCVNCGAEISDNTAFCTSCGQKTE